jgi:large subunit ribosomal protein L25
MTTTIVANNRTDSGKGLARKLRNTGKIPAVLYGVEAETLSLSVDPKALINIFQETRNRNTILEIDIEGKKGSGLGP